MESLVLVSYMEQKNIPADAAGASATKGQPSIDDAIEMITLES